MPRRVLHVPHIARYTHVLHVRTSSYMRIPLHTMPCASVTDGPPRAPKENVRRAPNINHTVVRTPSASPSGRSLCSQPDGDEEAVSDKCFITKTRTVNKGGSLRVEAFVPADVASSSQTLLATVHWRVNWGEETPVTMEEQGVQNDQRVFAATLPAAAVTQTGSMVRWRVGVRATPSQRLLCGTSRLVLLRERPLLPAPSSTTVTQSLVLGPWWTRDLTRCACM